MNTKKLNIFLADDDEDDRYLFTEALDLTRAPFQLHAVNNGEKVISFFKETLLVPDYVFLDINMPKVNGIECLRFIKNLYPSNTFHIIMLSTAISSQYIDLCYRYGASLYIKKPTRFENLIKFLQYCLFELKHSSIQNPFVLNNRLKIE